MKTITTLAVRHGGPVVTGVVLAVLSILPVAWSLQSGPVDWQASLMDWRPPGWPGALLIAACASLAAAVAGGYVGGRVHAEHRVGGALVALAIAWPLGITVLPLAAATFGVHLRTGTMCIDGCTAYLSDAAPWSGPGAYAQSFMGLIFVVPEVIAVVFLILARLALRRAHVILGIVFVVAAYGALHMYSVLSDGATAFACLGVGVVAWSAWLQARDRLRARADGTGRGPDGALDPVGPVDPAQLGRYRVLEAVGPTFVTGQIVDPARHGPSIVLAIAGRSYWMVPARETTILRSGNRLSLSRGNEGVTLERVDGPPTALAVEALRVQSFPLA
jgi:hypothetical protein